MRADRGQQTGGAVGDDFPEVCIRMERVAHRCRVEEISPGAARVRAARDERVPEGAQVFLEIPGYGRVPAEVVLLPDGAIGLLFLHDRASREAMQAWLSATSDAGQSLH